MWFKKKKETRKDKFVEIINLRFRTPPYSQYIGSECEWSFNDLMTMFDALICDLSGFYGQNSDVYQSKETRMYRELIHLFIGTMRKTSLSLTLEE